MEKARLAWAAFDLTLWKFANLQIVAENDPILLETQTVKKDTCHNWHDFSRKGAVSPSFLNAQYFLKSKPKTIIPIFVSAYN